MDTALPTRWIASLRTGSWLTAERAQVWALAALVAAVGGLVYLVATSNGFIDYQGRPLGTDFSNVYAAGTYVLEGRATAPFDPPVQYAREQAIFGESTPFYGWHYRPFFLFVAALLALMPYTMALAAWQGITLLLFLLAIRAIIRDGTPPAHKEADGARPSWLLLAAAFPAVFVNLGHGHNGFLTAALLGGGLVLLDRRPIVAGILFGLMAYKPQFGLMLPLALAADGRWRTIAAAAITVAALALITTLVFGVDVWSAFAASTRYSREIVLETGETGWHKIQSVFAWVRMWGGSVPLAYAAQTLLTVATAGAVIWLWRGNAPFPRKAAGLALAAILATPYSLDYDMMVLAPAIAFLAVNGRAHGFGAYEKTALAMLWLVPLVARPFAEATLVPLGVIAILAVFIIGLRGAGAFHRTGTAEPAAVQH